MSSDESIEVTEVALPGIGLRHDFVTSKGRRVGVVSHRSGKRELVIYDQEDPDACVDSVTLTGDEADTLAEYLGTHRVMERLATLSDQVSNLHTRKFPVSSGSRYDGKTLGDTHVRTRTGASIVAILRDGEAIASPTPDFGLTGNDTLILVGTDEALSAVGEILAE
ncbi:cation:proton antiporter regulatory subunit [Saxibacter everestensis]|uniref:Cation:proton antiporter regulatory subunit n=1 Tax=Saxibacter everestensis TaxID=2909229 RepID=A0ABY8QUM7_9MICO|nr:cation:proton antiporter regulatory subunit [Brevibacteriaceae bacterium ZFBP1038]